GAETSKQAGDRKTKAAAGTGDDDDLALEQVGPVHGRHGAKLGLRQAVVRCAFQGHGVGLSWHVDGGCPPYPAPAAMPMRQAWLVAGEAGRLDIKLPSATARRAGQAARTFCHAGACWRRA